MNEIQNKAYEIYINSASVENNFKPLSEEALSKELKNLGIDVSSSTLNRWKAKFNWTQSLESKIALAFSENKDVNKLLQKSSLEVAVKNTKVDIKRNDVLIASTYEVMENEMKRMLNDIKENGTIKKDDIEMFKFIASLVTTRNDKMLDRLAMMPPLAISSDEVVKRLNEITIDIECDDLTPQNDNQNDQNSD